MPREPRAYLTVYAINTDIYALMHRRLQRAVDRTAEGKFKLNEEEYVAVNFTNKIYTKVPQTFSDLLVKYLGLHFH